MKLKVWIERHSSTQVERYDVASGTKEKLTEIMNNVRIQLKTRDLPVYLRLGDRYLVLLKDVRSICFDLITEDIDLTKL